MGATWSASISRMAAGEASSSSNSHIASSGRSSNSDGPPLHLTAECDLVSDSKMVLKAQCSRLVLMDVATMASLVQRILALPAFKWTLAHLTWPHASLSTTPYTLHQNTLYLAWGSRQLPVAEHRDRLPHANNQDHTVLSQLCSRFLRKVGQSLPRQQGTYVSKLNDQQNTSFQCTRSGRPSLEVMRTVKKCCQISSSGVPAPQEGCACSPLGMAHVARGLVAQMHSHR